MPRPPANPVPVRGAHDGVAARAGLVARGALGALLVALPGSLAAQLPTWIIEPSARPALAELWRASLAARAERVACLEGRIGRDTVRITGALPVEGAADSVGAGAEASLAQCGAPRWIGTVHTHIRSTDDPEPVARFSPGDRAVMSVWAERWRRAGAFCILHSARDAHCEVYPGGGGPGREVLPPE